MSGKSMTKFTLSKVSMSKSMTKSMSRVYSNESSSNSDNEEEDEEEEVDDTKRYNTHRQQRQTATKTDASSTTDLESHDNTTEDFTRSSTQPRKSDNEGSIDDDSERIKENFINTFDEKGSFRVGAVDAIQITTVLEELSDKLDLVGVSIDTPQVDLRSKPSQESDAMFHRPLFTVPATVDPFSQSLFKEKYFLRQRYETTAPKRFRQLCGHEIGSGYRGRLSTVLRSHGVNRFTQKGKIYSDKTQLNIILDNVCTELLQNYSFNTMQDAVEQEKMNFREMQEKFDRKIQAEKRIQETKEQLKRTRIEKRTAMKDSREAMMGIEDSKQEILRRKELEYLSVHYTGAMMKTRVKKMCGKIERGNRSQHDDMKLKMRLCNEAHISMLDIIYKKYKETKKRLEYWQDKYELDKESLQSSLDNLKANRARDLERTKWLKAFIYDYNQICKDDRRIKGIETERERIAKLKDKKATKLQAWWRGEMVRKRLGPYMSPEERAKRKRAAK